MQGSITYTIININQVILSLAIRVFLVLLVNVLMRDLNFLVDDKLAPSLYSILLLSNFPRCLDHDKSTQHLDVGMQQAEHSKINKSIC